MYSVQLDENKYFTGSYAKVGSIPNGIIVSELPSDMSKATCYKYDYHDVTNIIQVPDIDEETGEQKLNAETNEPLFKEEVSTVSLLGWYLDEDKYLQEQIAQEVEHIRQQREEAFKLVDKYQLTLCYQALTEEQKIELTAYRNAWLDAPETKSIPTKPLWLK